jgi:hypothetical protein
MLELTQLNAVKLVGIDIVYYISTLEYYVGDNLFQIQLVAGSN